MSRSARDEMEFINLESDLATLKARAEKAERLLGHANALIEAQAETITEVSAQRDNLKSLCEKLKGYVGHKPTCQFLKYVNGPMKKCTCGLDELLKQGEK